MAPRDQRVIPKACSNCRRKKIRCDLTKPACRNCTQVYHVECTYDASLSYRSAEVLLARVAKAEGLLDMLAEDPASLPTILSEWKSSKPPSSKSNGNGNATIPVDNAQTSNDQAAQLQQLQFTSPLNFPSSSTHLRSASVISSSSHSENAIAATPAAPSLPSFRRPDSDAQVDEQLRFIRQLPSDLIDHLQYIHWTWQWPLHCFADRDATVQDLAHIQTDSPRYASPLLLLTMLAHAARFSNRVVVQTSSSADSFKMGGIFLTRAKQLLYKQLDAPPTLPDTAAILMMASRQVACGSFAQAWIYTGIAIRMIEDMGIPAMALSIASSPDPQGALHDQETRRAWRLFWSAFTFDKTLAFGLGRRPALSWPSEITRIWAGQPARDESPSWPECSQASSMHDPSGLRIPVMASIDSTEATSEQEPLRRTSHYPYETFAHWCSLSALLGEVLELSSRGQGQPAISDSRSTLARLREHLSEWGQNLPDHIAISHPPTETSSRPPNIMALNMVYHVCRILLHSSGRTGPAASSSAMRIHNLVATTPDDTSHDQNQDIEICRAAAIQIHALLEMWSRSFSFDRMTWLVGCCVYTAAVVNAQDVRHVNLQMAREAASRLNFASYALGISASFTPGIRKSTSALLEFAERINAEHRLRSDQHNAAETFVSSPSMHSSSSWNVSETSPANDHTRYGVVEPPARSKRKAQPTSSQGAQNRTSNVARRTVPLNGLDIHSRDDWNVGTVDLDAMFNTVLDGDHDQQAPLSGQRGEAYLNATGVMGSTTLPTAVEQPGSSSTAAGNATAMPILNDADASSILWDSIIGDSHWNLDAIINDTDLLDALGSLPLYPGEQL